MKRQVKVLLKHHNLIKKVYYKNNNKRNYRLWCHYMFIKAELKKWGYDKCGL